MHRILISGYYGFNNLGDEAILEAIINNLNKSIKNSEITVLSANPKITSTKYNVRSMNRKNIFKIIRAIKECNLLISGGGSLLQDTTSKRSIHYYLGIIGIGLLMRKKVMIYSQGIGPINKGLNRIITGFLLNKVDYITVRDQESKEDLVSMGVRENKIEVTADPVISIDRVGMEEGIKLLKKHGVDLKNTLIGFSLRGKNYDENTRQLLIEIVTELQLRFGARSIFLPFHYNEDVKLMDDLEKHLGDSAIFIKERHDVKEILSIIENLDLLVGVRLHSLIFSAVAGVPMIGISYDPKIDYFMRTIGFKSLCNIEDLSKMELINSIKEILENKSYFKNKIEDKVKEFRAKIKVNETKVNELLQ